MGGVILPFEYCNGNYLRIPIGHGEIPIFFSESVLDWKMEGEDIRLLLPAKGKDGKGSLPVERKQTNSFSYR